MKIMREFVLIVVAGVLFTGCSSPGVIQLSADTYVVSKSSAAGAFTNMAKLRASAIQEANAFAASQGKVAVAINARELVPTHGFPSYEYQFRLLDKNDPRARGISLEPRADVVIERSDKISADITTTDKSEKSPDLYTELTKLDDLRKKGLITDAEYEAEKKKVLERSK